MLQIFTKSPWLMIHLYMVGHPVFIVQSDHLPDTLLVQESLVFNILLEYIQSHILHVLRNPVSPTILLRVMENFHLIKISML